MRSGTTRPYGVHAAVGRLRLVMADGREPDVLDEHPVGGALERPLSAHEAVLVATRGS